MLFRLAAIGLAVTIAVMSLLPISGQASVPHADKVQHLIAYGALAGLVGLGWPRLRLPAVVALAAAFGVGVEVAQGLSGTGRTPSLADAVANTLGALIAAGVLSRIRTA